MAGYLVAHIDVTDPEGFKAYGAAVTPLVAQFGGRYRIRGGAAKAVEGTWTVPRLVVIEFESVAAAETFYNSPEYQAIIGLRLAASTGTVAIVEGYDS